MAARRLIGAALVGALAVLTLIAGGPAAVAAPGDLDPSFGGGDGIATLAATNPPGHGYEVVVEPDGKVVVLNRLAGAAGYDSLTRFNADGTLDTGFGVQGTAEVGRGFGFSSDLVVLADGSIVVVGTVAGGKSYGMALKYTPAGAPDASFGEGGMVLLYTDTLEGGSEAVAVYEQAGRLVVVGTKNELIGADYVGGVLAVRLLANGTPDPTFGTGGESWSGDRTLQVDQSFTTGGIALQPDGSVLVAAVLAGDGGATVYAYRLGPDGALNATGGSADQVGPAVSVTSAAPVPGGGMLVAANVLDVSNAVLLRVLLPFTASGAAAGRVAETSPHGFQDLAALPDGRIALATSDEGLGTTGAVEIRTAAGALDAAFAGDGSADGFIARGVAASPGGKLVAVGGPWETIEVRRYDAGISTSPAEGPIPLVPSRILDTRTGVGYTGPKPVAGSTITLAVAGRGGVPASGAAAVVLNLTATESDAPGFVTVWPAGQPQPNASNVNVDTPGQTIANLVTVPLAANGTVSIFNYGGSHLLADVAAWFPAGGGFVPLTPSRILDTRSGIGYSGPKPAADATLQLSVVGQGGVGPDATAVVLNVTATEADTAGFVTVWPTGQARPNASNVNIAGAGQTIPNQVYVPVGTGGSVSLYTYGGVHLLADVAGYFTAGGAFHPLTPNRILDTRAAAGPIGYTGSKPTAGAVVSVSVAGAGGVPPSGATAVVMNVTATESDGPGFVTAWPTAAAQPNASNLNLDTAGQTIANLVVVPLGPDGRVNLFTFGGGHLLADVAGWVG